MHRDAVQHIEMRRPCGAQSLIEEMWAQRVPVQRLCPSDLPPAPNTPLSSPATDIGNVGDSHDRSRFPEAFHPSRQVKRGPTSWFRARDVGYNIFIHVRLGLLMGR